ncbi:MAG: 3-deoxy-D-manno-octulosonic acid transferase [Phycisphaerales bacterium]
MNLYDLAYLTGAGLLAPVWARKKRDGWPERFGHIDHMLTHELGNGARVVLHAVSVGEVSALRAIVPQLLEHADVIVSTTTDTGLARATSLYGSMCDVVRTPLDFSWSVRRFLDKTNPDAVGLVELEVWPNLIKQCVKRDIPIGVINGRLSERSFKGYMRARPVLGRSFRKLSFACVQDETYADRFRAMRVSRDLVSVAGSMKWDAIEVADGSARSVEAIGLARTLGLDLDRPIVVGGSTAEGEEALLHSAVSSDVQLVCAPRKPERFDEAARDMPGCVRRSNLPGTAAGGQNRFLLDSIGELSTLYRIADVAVIGRSFGDLYGSDPTEPAGLGVPVLIGPRYGDFESAVGLLEDAGGLRVTDREGVGSEIARLLEDSGEREQMGQRARSCVMAQQGASERHAGVLLRAAGGSPERAFGLTRGA